MPTAIPKLLEKVLRLARSLPQACTVEDFMEIHRAAEAVRMQARRAKLDLAIQIRAAEIKLRADRGAGRLLLKSSRLHVGRSPVSSLVRKAGVSRQKATADREANKKQYQHDTILKEFSLTKVESARLQKVARLPERDYQQYLAECRAEEKVPSSQGLLRLAERLRVEGRLLKSPRARDGQSDRAPAQQATRSIERNTRRHNDLRRSDDDAFTLAEMHCHVREVMSDLADYFADTSTSNLERVRREVIERRLSEVDAMLDKLRSDRRHHNPT